MVFRPWIGKMKRTLLATNDVEIFMTDGMIFTGNEISELVMPANRTLIEMMHGNLFAQINHENGYICGGYTTDARGLAQSAWFNPDQFFSCFGGQRFYHIIVKVRADCMIFKALQLFCKLMFFLNITFVFGLNMDLI